MPWDGWERMPGREIDNSLNVWEFQVPQFSFTSKLILLTQILWWFLPQWRWEDDKDECVLSVSGFLVVYTRGRTEVDGQVTTHKPLSVKIQGMQVMHNNQSI